MKIKKILAAAAAAAIAISAMTVNAFALSTKNYLKDGTLFLVADKEGDPTWAKDAGIAVTDVYGVTFHVTFDANEVADEATWLGGGIGANSNSTGWKQVEWGRKDKTITPDFAKGTITWLSDAPIFKADDAFAHLWLQAWGGKITVDSADVLGKGGTVISDDADVVAAAPAAVEAAPAEDAAAVDAVEATEEEVTLDAEEAAEEEVTLDTEEAVDETADVEVAVVEEAPAADTATTAATTGNTAAAVMISVMAIAGAAALVSKKVK